MRRGATALLVLVLIGVIAWVVNQYWSGRYHFIEDRRSELRKLIVEQEIEREARPCQDQSTSRYSGEDDDEERPVAVIVLGGAHDLSGSVHRHDGVQGVELAEAFRPDLIVLDIGLPKLNGYDACRRIREQPWAKDILIVAATGWGQDEDRRHSKEAGFDHHLVKPVDAAEINRLLAERKA